jgi:hypothetical protein
MIGGMQTPRKYKMVPFSIQMQKSDLKTVVFGGVVHDITSTFSLLAVAVAFTILLDYCQLQEQCTQLFLRPKMGQTP